MLTFLFWNLAGKSLERQVARLASAHDVDIVVLAEPRTPAEKTAESLNQHVGSQDQYFDAGFSECDRIVVLSRFDSSCWQSLDESSYYTLRKVNPPSCPEFILGALHLRSKLHLSPESQLLEARDVANTVRDIEQRVGHSRTVLVGDFNMNPFEAGMTAAPSFHSVMTRSIAKKGSRTVVGVDYPYFYNPMWGHFGDRFPGPAGSCYHAMSEHIATFWSMFDQVLIRPQIVDAFVIESLSILDHDGEAPLVNKSGLPNRKTVSDHLPIKFSLNL